MKLKSWQGWLLFFGAMLAVFIMGIFAASITERRAEVISIYANKKVDIPELEARNEIFNANYPREYQTWRQTEDTSFVSEFNGSQSVDVLEQRPNMVILWAGYSFSKDYSTPRGHMHGVKDVHQTLRTGSPGVDQAGDVQPATCWACKSPDVPRMMNKLGVSAFYKSTWSEMGPEIVNPIGCADCHDPKTMDLHISRPALIEAFERQGKDITKSTLQEMRSLVCARGTVVLLWRGRSLSDLSVG